MRHLIVFVTLLFISFTSVAGIDSKTVYSAGWEQLSESEKAEFLKNVADKAKKNSGPEATVSTVKNVSEWVDVGQKIGQMMGGAAKEVGVAVNDFVKTPVGQWTMALIIWKFMGSALVHVFGGLLVLIVGFSFIIFLMKRSVSVVTKYDSEKVDMFGRSRLLSVTRGELSDDESFGYFVGAGFVILAFIAVTFTF